MALDESKTAALNNRELLKESSNICLALALMSVGIKDKFYNQPVSRRRLQLTVGVLTLSSQGGL